jgi:YHS domain-containing protein
MLIRILLLIILLVLLGRAIRSLLASVEGASPGAGRRIPPRGVRMVRDPICGTFLPPSHALAVPARDGAILYFCSEACRQEYAAQERRS